MTNAILAFCGMPGTAEDLEILQPLIKGARICGAASVEQAAAACAGEKPVCAGYSRGCWNAMLYASKYPVSSVVLIAPHWGSRASPFLRFLLRIPLLGTALLRVIGPRSIRKMLRKTAFPKEAPAAYRALEGAYSQPAMLRSALLSPAHSIEEAKSLIQSLQAPVRAIAGECDKALPMAQALRPWLESLAVIPQAGHALPWTHGEACAALLY